LPLSRSEYRERHQIAGIQKETDSIDSHARGSENAEAIQSRLELHERLCRALPLRAIAPTPLQPKISFDERRSQRAKHNNPENNNSRG
jgi:hypothetical protein